MTVTFAFKAFAKAIPCVTPFFATSDPSVLKRIWVYIRGSRARRTFSPESDPHLYGPIVAVRLRAIAVRADDHSCPTTPSFGTGITCTDTFIWLKASAGPSQ